jgi:hypothetical protein
MSGQLPTEWPIEAVPLLQLAAYVQYQVGHCYSLASICAAETALSSNQAGQAVALAQLGTNLCEQLADLGFEQSGFIDPVSTLGPRDSSRRLALQATLEQKAANVLRRYALAGGRGGDGGGQRGMCAPRGGGGRAQGGVCV